MNTIARTTFITILLVGSAACPGRTNVECESNDNCDLMSGGVCLSATTGNSWCAYPDQNCPGGFRYSDVSVGDGLSGQCVDDTMMMADGGIDSPIDAAPGANFVRSFGGAGIDRGISVATKGDGVYVAGMINGSVDLGGGARSGPGFLAKYDEMGQHVWSIGLPAIPRDIAIDSFGNAYILGEFSNSLTFGGPTHNPQGGYDFYVAKFDGANGGFLMSRSYGGAASEEGRRIAILPNDDYVVAGLYNATTNLGGTNLTNNGGDDVFVAKFSRTNGLHIWSAGFGGTSNDNCFGLVTTPTSSVVVLGAFADSFTFNGTTNASTGFFDLYVAGFDAAGAPSWHQRYGSSRPDLFADAALSPQGDIVAVGTFGEDFTMGPSALNNNAGTDAFVARISPTDGTTVWATSMSGAAEESAGGVAVVGDQVVLAGLFQGTATIGGETVMAAGAGTDLYLAHVNYSDGVAIGARTLGGANGTITGAGELAGLADTVVMTGAFQGMADFGLSILNNATTMDDLYIARVRP